MSGSHGSWRLKYQRAGWVHPAWKYFHRRETLDDYLDQLLDFGRPDLAPLILLQIDTRPVGPWETEAVIIGRSDA